MGEKPPHAKGYDVARQHSRASCAKVAPALPIGIGAGELTRFRLGSTGLFSSSVGDIAIAPGSATRGRPGVSRAG